MPEIWIYKTTFEMDGIVYISRNKLERKELRKKKKKTHSEYTPKLENEQDRSAKKWTRIQTNSCENEWNMIKTKEAVFFKSIHCQGDSFSRLASGKKSELRTKKNQPTSSIHTSPKWSISN